MVENGRPAHQLKLNDPKWLRGHCLEDRVNVRIPDPHDRTLYLKPPGPLPRHEDELPSIETPEHLLT